MAANPSIKWITFAHTQDGITVQASFWAKDYNIRYDSPYGPMSTGKHIMYMCPRVYTLEEVRDKCCPKAVAEFLWHQKFLDDHPGYLEQQRALVQKARREPSAQLERARERRIELKARFKAGLVSQKEYMAFCEEVKALEDRLWTVGQEIVRNACARHELDAEISEYLLRMWEVER